MAVEQQQRRLVGGCGAVGAGGGPLIGCWAHRTESRDVDRHPRTTPTTATPPRGRRA
ncbi:hypothetical protein BTZ20_3233 [Rhodococcus sp. MTM3W5.2]|nr:hypothetical protein BTZ20_3233 [Rhodococcus sp. MTM3W5.2]